MPGLLGKRCRGIAFLVVSVTISLCCHVFHLAILTLLDCTDTVNFASRMESTSVKMKIQIAELTYRLLQDSPNMMFVLEKRKEGDNVGIEVKGKGHQITYVCVYAFIFHLKYILTLYPLLLNQY